MDWNDFTLTKSGAEWVLNSLMQTFLLSILGVLFYCAFKRSSTRLKSRLLTSIVIAMLTCPVIALPYNFWKKSSFREVSRVPRYFVENINNHSNSGASLSPETSTPNGADTERVFVKDLSDPIDTQSREISSLKEPLLIPESFIRIVATIWFSGILLCGFMLTLSWFRLRRWTSCLKPVQDPRLLNAWKSITGRSTEQHPILTLPLNHPVFSPYVFGLTKPKLVLPKEFASRLSASELRSVLVHEWAHICNRDLILGLFQRLFRMIYWWNPLAHWINRRLTLTREILCDQEAVRTIGSAKEYASTLVKLIEHSQESQLRNSSPAFQAHAVSLIHERIKTLGKKDITMESNKSLSRKSIALYAMVLSLSLFIYSIHGSVAESADPESDESQRNPVRIELQPVVQTEGMVTRQVLAPALGGMGTTSPDGRYVSTVNWTKGNLAVHELATGENRDLTDEGTWVKPNQWCDVSIWSPDSQQIAYYWIDNGNGSSLRIVGLDGSEYRVVASGNSELGDDAPWPREWSKDGKYILALQTKKNETQTGHELHIVLVTVADGSVRVLKSLGERWTSNMSLSPDGRYVVYELSEEHGSNKRDIYLLATNGSSEVALVEHPAEDKAPFWTPDGKRIVFLSDRSGSMDLWILDVADGKPKGTPTLVKAVGNKIQPMGFTKDGSFYYRVGNLATDVYVATLDFESGKILASPTKTSLRFEGSNNAPIWSPDGNYLAYASRRGASDNYVLVIRSVETGEERDLSVKSLTMQHAISHTAPQWTPDGRSILVAGFTHSTRGLYLVDVQSGEFTSILQYGGDPITQPRWPVFSKNGKLIYYILDRSIMAFNLETRGERELYKVNKSIVRLACSPDGRRLAFFESSQDGQPAVVKTISTSGGDSRELFTLHEGQQLFWGVGISWTPDGRHVVVGGPPVPGKQGADSLPDDLLIIPVAGGEPRKVKLEVKLRQMSLHPDGERIAFASQNPKGGTEVWVMENFLP